jgi:hypothetical protein
LPEGLKDLHNRWISFSTAGHLDLGNPDLRSAVTDLLADRIIAAGIWRERKAFEESVRKAVDELKHLGRSNGLLCLNTVEPLPELPGDKQ